MYLQWIPFQSNVEFTHICYSYVAVALHIIPQCAIKNIAKLTKCPFSVLISECITYGMLMHNDDYNVSISSLPLKDCNFMDTSNKKLCILKHGFVTYHFLF